MGQTYAEIPDYLIDWLQKQHMFWVATAPLTSYGHINISPKGVAGTFHVASPTKVWYEDLSGSGAETIAHIRENGRVTILFNAFEGPPRIARLYGAGSYHEFGTPEYNKLLPPGTRQPGSRAVIIVDIWKVGTTCGYSVPDYNFIGHRVRLLDWAAKKEKIDYEASATIEEESLPSLPSTQNLADSTAEPITENIHPNGMLSWWKDRNLYSLDGLPALSLAFKTSLGIGSHKTIPKGQPNPVQRRRRLTKPQANPGQDIRATSDLQTRTNHHHHAFPNGLAKTWVWIALLWLMRASAAFRYWPFNRARLSPFNAPLLPKDSIPNSDADESSVGITMPVGSNGQSESSEPEALLEPPAWSGEILVAKEVEAPLLGYFFSFLLGAIFTLFLKELQQSSLSRTLLHSQLL